MSLAVICWSIIMTETINYNAAYVPMMYTQVWESLCVEQKMSLSRLKQTPPCTRSAKVRDAVGTDNANNKSYFCELDCRLSYSSGRACVLMDFHNVLALHSAGGK